MDKLFCELCGALLGSDEHEICHFCCGSGELEGGAPLPDRDTIIVQHYDIAPIG